MEGHETLPRREAPSDSVLIAVSCTPKAPSKRSNHELLSPLDCHDPRLQLQPASSIWFLNALQEASSVVVFFGQCNLHVGCSMVKHAHMQNDVLKILSQVSRNWAKAAWPERSAMAPSLLQPPAIPNRERLEQLLWPFAEATPAVVHFFKVEPWGTRIQHSVSHLGSGVLCCGCRMPSPDKSSVASLQPLGW